MKTSIQRIAAVVLTLSTSLRAQDAAPVGGKPLAELQRDLVNLRFGMFICASPVAYLDLPDHFQPDHAPPRQGRDEIEGTPDDLHPTVFNPAKLDCGQWADAAASAGMKTAVFLTKHHDGFCLWPSKYSTYTVAQGCKRDVVREFVDAFRQRGMAVGLYYSIRDRTERIASDAAHGGVSPEKIQFIKNQLTELLTNYGDIAYLMFDAWGNTWHESPSFYDIPYAEIHHHIKSLQPNCLILNHSRVRSVSDVLQIELRAGMGLPSGADWAAAGGDTLQEAWFWRADYPTAPLRPVEWIVDEKLRPYNQRNLLFFLNCAPNRDGLMDANVIARLAEVGKAWTPPPPLQTIPDSWKNWPVPPTVHLLAGANIAQNKPVRFSLPQKIASAEPVVDGNPNTSIDLAGKSTWLEIDLGDVRPLAGLHIWNRNPAKNVILEQGLILVSEQPFQSDDPALIQKQAGVTTIPITEPPGYPSAFSLNVAGRYVRLVSTSGAPIGIGEIEVFSTP